MKQYQSWLGQYLMSRRDGDHAMASELANSICEFWQAQGTRPKAANGSSSTSSTWKRPPEGGTFRLSGLSPIKKPALMAPVLLFRISDYIWSTMSWANWEQERRVAPSISRSKS